MNKLTDIRRDLRYCQELFEMHAQENFEVTLCVQYVLWDYMHVEGAHRVQNIWCDLCIETFGNRYLTPLRWYLCVLYKTIRGSISIKDCVDSAIKESADNTQQKY